MCDFRVLGNRSCSYLGLGQLEKAREDAELACRLHPFWAKVGVTWACLCVCVHLCVLGNGVLVTRLSHKKITA